MPHARSSASCRISAVICFRIVVLVRDDACQVIAAHLRPRLELFPHVRKLPQGPGNDKAILSAGDERAVAIHEAPVPEHLPPGRKASSPDGACKYDGIRAGDLIIVYAPQVVLIDAYVLIAAPYASQASSGDVDIVQIHHIDAAADGLF